MTKIKHPSRRTLAVLAVVVPVVAMVAGTTAYLKTMVADRDACNGREDNELYANAARAITAKNKQELGEVVSSMKESDKYQKEPNCLYAAFSYAILQDDLKQADTVFRLLVEHTGSNDQFVAAYHSQAKGIKDLQQQMTAFRKTRSEPQSVQVYFQLPEDME